jgi:hypothetical protein
MNCQNNGSKLLIPRTNLTQIIGVHIAKRNIHLAWQYQHNPSKDTGDHTRKNMTQKQNSPHTKIQRDLATRESCRWRDSNGKQQTWFHREADS